MRTINRIVVHYTDSPDVPAAIIRQWHLARGFRDIGYHRVIRKDGSVEKGRPEQEVGAHAKGFNENSLGVALTGSNSENWYPAEAQIKSLKKVLLDWTSRYNIIAINLHRELNPTSCPGKLTKDMFLDFAAPETPTPAPTMPRGRQDEKPRLPILMFGSRQPAVALLQKRLYMHRVPVTIDGIFGKQTLHAVRLFQKAHGLVVDGIVGPKTWQKLLSPPG